MATINMLIIKHMKQESVRSVIDVVVDKEINTLSGIVPEEMEKQFRQVGHQKNTYRLETEPGDLLVLELMKSIRRKQWQLMTSHSFVHLSIEKIMESHFYFERVINPIPSAPPTPPQTVHYTEQQSQSQTNHNTKAGIDEKKAQPPPVDSINRIKSDPEVAALILDRSKQQGPYTFTNRSLASAQKQRDSIPSKSTEVDTPQKTVPSLNLPPTPYPAAPANTTTHTAPSRPVSQTIQSSTTATLPTTTTNTTHTVVASTQPQSQPSQPPAPEAKKLSSLFSPVSPRDEEEETNHPVVAEATTKHPVASTQPPIISAINNIEKTNDPIISHPAAHQQQQQQHHEHTTDTTNNDGMLSSDDNNSHGEGNRIAAAGRRSSEAATKLFNKYQARRKSITTGNNATTTNNTNTNTISTPTPTAGIAAPTTPAASFGSPAGKEMAGHNSVHYVNLITPSTPTTETNTTIADTIPSHTSHTPMMQQHHPSSSGNGTGTGTNVIPIFAALKDSPSPMTTTTNTAASERGLSPILSKSPKPLTLPVMMMTSGEEDGDEDESSSSGKNRGEEIIPTLNMRTPNKPVDEQHESERTNHYSKLGSAFVSSNVLNSGRRGVTGGGRGRGRGIQ